MNHVVVTGAAGFLGAQLCRRLLARGDRVTAIDNLSMRRRPTDLLEHPHWTLRTVDTAAPGAFAELDDVTQIAHLAHPGSPVAAARQPVEVLRAACVGTLAALDLAAAHTARIVLASGPQPGPGPLSYDRRTTLFDPHSTGHHLIETVAHRYRHVDTGIARFFEVYGPGLPPGDGRITAALCAAALRDQTLYLPQHRTYAFLYLTDAVDALITMLDNEIPGPIDIGGPPLPLTEFAHTAVTLAGTGWLESPPPPLIETCSTAPNLAHTETQLRWRPTTSLHTGLRNTLDWMRTIVSIDKAPNEL